MDQNWRYTYLNERAAAIIGKKPEDLIGKVIWEDYPELLGTPLEETYRKVMETRTIARIEQRGILSKRWYNIFAFPVSKGITIYWQDITEQKKLEDNHRHRTEELQNKEKEYLEIIDSVAEGTFINDLERGELHISCVWKKRLGMANLSPRQTAESFLTLVHPDDLEAMQMAYMEACKKRAPMVKMEFRAKTITGIIWIQGQAKIYYNGDGKPVKYLGAHMDITERKIAEEELAFQAHILSSIQDAICAVDGNFHITYWNGMAEKMFGWTASEAIGSPSKDIFRMVLPSKREESIANLLKNNGYLGEAVYRKKDGKEIYTNVVCSVIRNAQGAYMGNVSTYRDITERKKAEEALRESEEKYRSLFDNAEYGFVLIEPLHDENGQVNDLRYLEINPAFESQTGLKAKDFLGKRLKEALPGVEPYFLAEFDKALKSNKPTRTEGYNNDTGRWYEQVVFPYPNGLLGEQFIDTTERKRLEQHKTFLLEISRDLAEIDVKTEKMDHLCEKIGRYFDITWCMFTELIEDAEYTIVSNCWNTEGVVSLKGIRRRMRDFITDELLAVHNAGDPIIVRDTQTDPRVSAEEYGQMDMMSFINAPISQCGQWRFLISIMMLIFSIMLKLRILSKPWRAKIEFTKVMYNEDHIETN